VWLEAALNGAWTRRKQPSIPLSPDEIIAEGLACVAEGASILHYHAYDPLTGHQTDSVDVNVRILESIREKADVIVYPALTSITAPQVLAPGAGEIRYATHEALARKGLVEWMVVDPGSVNMSPLGNAADAAGPQGYLYLNTEQTLGVALELARRESIRPSFAIYEPGFIRLGAMLARRHGTLTPVYRLMFSDQFSFGFPPRDFALEAYVRFLSQEVPGAPWMLAGLGVDIEPLIPMAVALGGHVRVGLEDARLGSPEPSAAAVRRAARAIDQAGARVATAAEVRASLKQAS
jgi:uncharacterized protein (DUF849 family)